MNVFENTVQKNLNVSLLSFPLFDLYIVMIYVNVFLNTFDQKHL